MQSLPNATFSLTDLSFPKLLHKRLTPARRFFFCPKFNARNANRRSTLSLRESQVAAAYLAGIVQAGRDTVDGRSQRIIQLF